jgi:hypothetical protein
MKRIAAFTIPWTLVMALVACGGGPPERAPSAVPHSPIAVTNTALPTATPEVYTLEVTTSVDLVNGNTASVEKLLSDPGQDGISLREAIQTVNRGTGASRISFSPALSGSTIALSNELVITQSRVTIEGLTDPSGQPGVTIHISDVPRGGFRVLGSHIVIRNLRMSGLRGAGGLGGVFLEPADGGTVSDVVLEGNVFEGTGENASAAISLRHPDESKTTTVRDVVIRGNTFVDFRNEADCIHIGSRGQNSLRENILIAGNTFRDCTYPVELEDGGAGNSIRNVRILGNAITGGDPAVSIGAIGDQDTSPVGNIISDILIRGNDFEGNDSAVLIMGGYVNPGTGASSEGNAVQDVRVLQNVFRKNRCGVSVVGGSNGAKGNTVKNVLIQGNLFEAHWNPAIGLLGGSDRASDNLVANTNIVNNIIAENDDGAVSLSGGYANASGNTIDGTRIANNTIAGNVNDHDTAAIGISIGDTENAITDLVIVNSIFWGNLKDFWNVDPDRVSFSVTKAPGFAGKNHNVAGDPLFVDAESGDYRLRAGSPAIDAGNGDFAPPQDFECSDRYDDPIVPNTGVGSTPFSDIGAFEFDDADTRCPDE